MAYLGFRLAFPLTMLFTALIGLVQAQPVIEDGALAAFLTPPLGCPAPCWEGIRPGVTTVDTVIHLLEAHPWVDHVIITESFGATGNGFIGWVWSGTQPAPINGNVRGAVWVNDGVVQSVRIPTTISFGALWLQFDRPQQGSLRLALDTRGLDYVVIHYAAFPQHKFVAWSEVECPLRPPAFWGANMFIQFTNTMNRDLTDYALPQWLAGSPCG